MTNKDFAYKVDDEFKNYYFEKVLPRRDYIADYLNNLDTIGKDVVLEKLEKENDILHGIALTENVIYDYEQKSSKR